MTWSERHGMWVDRDDRSAERRTEDQAMLRRAHADRARIGAALRNAQEARTRAPTPAEKAAARVARDLLDALARARKERGLSLATVANRMGVSPAAIGRLEKGTHSPTLATLARYSAAIGVALEVAGASSG